ncbi:hypothetical protein ACMFMG_005733 [Clarireedia jacksonii]
MNFPTQPLAPVSIHLGSYPLLKFVVYGLFTLVTWRFVRFTLIPYFRPNDPKELPYWMPFVGHTFSFFQNPQALLDVGMQKIGGAERRPFALFAFGITNYILTNPKDVGDAYKETETLSFSLLLRATLVHLGLAKSSVRSMFHPLAKDKAGFPNPNGKSLASLSRDIHLKQLWPGENQTILVRKLMDWFNVHLTSSRIIKERPYTIADGQDVVVPLMALTSEMMVSSGQNAYFGPTLAELAPDLPADFLEFDELSWQLLLQYPPMFCQPMLKAKARVELALQRYIEIPMEQRKGDIWFTKAMEAELKALNIPTNEIGIMFMTVYWGFNTNSRRATFWLLAYSLFTPGLIDELREEMIPAVKTSEIDHSYILEKCPKYSAVWQETLRMAASAASVRFVSEDTSLNGYTLRKGNRVIVPFRKLHLDPGVFGSDAKEFKADRFAKDPSLHRHIRAFGGGSTYCPGRHLSKLWIGCIVAMLLDRFDLVLEGEQPFPEGSEETPSLGMLGNSGNDLMVRLKPRTKLADAC